jgi:hypothetical protein
MSQNSEAPPRPTLIEYPCPVIPNVPVRDLANASKARLLRRTVREMNGPRRTGQILREYAQDDVAGALSEIFVAPASGRLS